MIFYSFIVHLLDVTSDSKKELDKPHTVVIQYCSLSRFFFESDVNMFIFDTIYNYTYVHMIKYT